MARPSPSCLLPRPRPRPLPPPPRLLPPTASAASSLRRGGSCPVRARYFSARSCTLRRRSASICCRNCCSWAGVKICGDGCRVRVGEHYLCRWQGRARGWRRQQRRVSADAAAGLTGFSDTDFICSSAKKSSGFSNGAMCKSNRPEQPLRPVELTACTPVNLRKRMRKRDGALLHSMGGQAGQGGDASCFAFSANIVILVADQAAAAPPDQENHELVAPPCPCSSCSACGPLLPVLGSACARGRPARSLPAAGEAGGEAAPGGAGTAAGARRLARHSRSAQHLPVSKIPRCFPGTDQLLLSRRLLDPSGLQLQHSALLHCYLHCGLAASTC